MNGRRHRSISGCSVTFLVFICLFSGSLSPAKPPSKFARQTKTIFRENTWQKMAAWVDEQSRIYLRIPNLQTGFVTADQARRLFKEMEKRFDTRKFKLITDEGSPESRWLIRAQWSFFDRNFDRTFTYTIELGWEYTRKVWRLVIFQAQ